MTLLAYDPVLADSQLDKMKHFWYTHMGLWQASKYTTEGCGSYTKDTKGVLY